MMKRLIRACLLAAFTVSLCSAADREHSKTTVDVSKLPPPAAKKDVTYVSDIQPIFEKSCVKCHSAEKPKGKLRLDSLDAALKGGEDGKVIKAGNSAESILVHNIAQIGDPDEYMPPPKNKAGIQPLKTEQIALIRAWIDQGAK